MEKINCPICNSEKISFYFSKNQCNIYKCNSCYLFFVYPIPNNLKKIYKKDYFKNKSFAVNSKQAKNEFGYTDYDEDKKPMKNTFLNYFKIIEKYKKGGSILDIGAATGFFLDIAKEKKWQTFGSEISKFATNIAIERGHKMYNESLSNLPKNSRYDVVTMWDVLEHLDNPKSYLEKLNKILKSDGILLINTIDKGSLWARIFGKKWHLIVPPEHLFYFSARNLKILLESAGFRIVEQKKIGKKFSLAYIFKTLYSWQGLEIFNKLSKYFERSFWRKIFIPINLRDNIFIVAEKK